MTDGETTRLVAWSAELRRVHARLREALQLTRDALAEGQSVETASGDLLLHCHGFCAALDGHHRGEDRALFPAIEAAHPELAPTLRVLEQDHSMIGHLLEGLRAAVDRQGTRDELALHIEGIGAIMENHFRFEEKKLLTVLETLQLRAAVDEVLGPL